MGEVHSEREASNGTGGRLRAGLAEWGSAVVWSETEQCDATAWLVSLAVLMLLLVLRSSCPFLLPFLFACQFCHLVRMRAQRVRHECRHGLGVCLIFGKLGAKLGLLQMTNGWKNKEKIRNMESEKQAAEWRECSRKQRRLVTHRCRYMT